MHVEGGHHVAVQPHGIAQINHSELTPTGGFISHGSTKVCNDKTGISANGFAEINNRKFVVAPTVISTATFKIETCRIRIEVYCLVKVNEGIIVLANCIIADTSIGKGIEVQGIRLQNLTACINAAIGNGRCAILPIVGYYYFC